MHKTCQNKAPSLKLHHEPTHQARPPCARPNPALVCLLFEGKMKKNLAIALLAGIALVICSTSCDREYKRHAHIVGSLLTTANTWLTNNSYAGKGSCEVVFLNGDPQLDVVGIVVTDQQDAFAATIRTNPIQPSRIRFWSEKPAFPFIDIVVPEVSSAPPEKLEAEAKQKLLRTVNLRK